VKDTEGTSTNFKPQTPDTDLEVIDKRFTAQAPVVQDDTPNAAIMLALQKGTDPAIIEKLMDLAERQEANIARKAYVKAKALFKKTAPIVIRDTKNAQYGSMYASETALMNTINPYLGEVGLDVSFDFPEVEKGMAVTCILTHELGHSERVTLPGPLDESGKKNPLQQVKSTVTYLRKATFEAITGIASSDPTSDDDGNSGNKKEPKFITEKQVKEITKRIKEIYGDDPSMFFTWIEAETVDTITDYAKAKKGLDGAEKAKAKKDAADKDESRLGE
jgi:hypothetical protein